MTDLVTTKEKQMTELTMTCEQCEKPVIEREGFIGISHEERRRAEAAEAKKRTPLDVTWRVRHYACAAGDLDIYGINPAELHTWKALARWTSHLMGKPWIGLTDWDVLLEEIAKGDGSRIAVSA